MLRVKQRKFKDLNPENKTKRKEPIKSWDRRERLTILFVFLVTIILSAGLAISARNYKLPNLPRLKISLPKLSSKTIVIEGNKELKQKSEKVSAFFKKKTNKLSGVYALYVIDLNSGFSYGVNENEKMQATSLIKLVAITALYRKAEMGEINLNTKYPLRNSDKIAGLGSLSSKPAGYVLTYADIASLIGKESDNTSFGIIRKMVGEEKIDEEIRRIGMVSTDIKTNTTTPADTGLFFQKLYNGKILNREHKDEVMGYLDNSIYKNWIRAGIPDNIKVAHEYNRGVHSVDDVGVIFSKKPYVLVVMSDGVIGAEADEIFPELVKMVYYGG